MDRAVFPPCCLTWGQTMAEVMKIMVTSFKRSQTHTATLGAPGPAAGHHWPISPPETPGHSQASLDQSHGGDCTFLLGLGAHKVLFVPSKCVFPQSCVKFWQLYGGINGDLLQEGLCHTQGCCTQSPWPCGSPLLTRTSAGDSQTLKGRSGSVSVGSPGAHKALSEPSEHLWWVWGSILNAVSPLLLSCWCFSFALGCGIFFLVGSNILLPTIVQQRGVSLEFSQEKMSACPSTPPSFRNQFLWPVIILFKKSRRSLGWAP